MRQEKAPAVPAPKSKSQTLLKMLDEGMVMLHVFAPHPDVRVPARFKSTVPLNLNLSYRFNLDDLVIDEVGVRCTLSFNQTPFFCEIPWEALLGVTSDVTGKSVVWVPEEPAGPQRMRVRIRGAAPKAAGGEAVEAPPQERPRPVLRRVK